MQVSMTERDKKLLAALACVLIVVGFIWYLIIPATQRLDQLDEDIQIAEMQQQEMQMKINTLPTIKDTNGELKILAGEVTADYYDLMTSQEVDKELTNLVLDKNLECVGLDIQPIEFSKTEAYVRSRLAREKELNQAMENLQEDTGSQEGADSAAAAAETYAATDTTVGTEADGETQDQIYSYQVQITAEGDEADYQELIDMFVNGYPAVRVTGISYKDSTPKMLLQEDGSLVESDRVRQLVLGLEMYMCDKSLN